MNESPPKTPYLLNSKQSQLNYQKNRQKRLEKSAKLQ